MKARRKRSSQQQAQLEQQLAHYTTQAASHLPQDDRHRQPGTWVSYAAAAGAALVMAPAVDAIPVYSGLQNLMIAAPGASTSFFSAQGIDLNNDGSDDVAFGLLRYFPPTAPATYTSAAAFLLGSVLVQGTTFPTNYLAKQFSFGEPVGPGITSFIGGLQIVYAGANIGSWGNSEKAFAGLQFYDQNSDLHFAWLRVHVEDDTDGRPTKITVIDWAYESDPDTAIPAGAPVPEPSTGSLALLAMGAVGLYEWRRRRKQRASQD